MTAPGYKIVAVPDVIRPDGTVQCGPVPVSVLRDRRRYLWDQSVQLCEIAAAGKRVLTKDEVSCWDLLSAEITELDIRIAMYGVW